MSDALSQVGSSLFGTPDTSSAGYQEAKANVILAEEGKEGLSGFKFAVHESYKVDRSADITDHYTESGNPIQDHRVFKPTIITISGYEGELVASTEKGVLAAFGSLSNRLSVIDTFTGGKTPMQLQEAKKVVTDAAAVAAVAQNVGENLSTASHLLQDLGPSPTKQQVAYKKLDLLFYSETLLTLQTPWNFFTNLLITNLSFTRGQDSKISNIKVTLKEIRPAEDLKYTYSDYLNPFTSSRHAVQSSPLIDQGNVQGVATSSTGTRNKSLLKSGLDKVFGGS